MEVSGRVDSQAPPCRDRRGICQPLDGSQMPSEPRTDAFSVRYGGIQAPAIQETLRWGIPPLDNTVLFMVSLFGMDILSHRKRFQWSMHSPRHH